MCRSATTTVSFRESQMRIRGEVGAEVALIVRNEASVVKWFLTVREEASAEVVLDYQEEAVDEGGIDYQGRGRC